LFLYQHVLQYRKLPTNLYPITGPRFDPLTTFGVVPYVVP
jgi:hypothetical protein